jgi:hypothetical protein
VFVQPLPWSAGYFVDAEGCDFDGDGWDEVVEVGSRPYLDGPPAPTVRDLRTGAVHLQFDQPGGGNRSPLHAFVCTDVDGDGLLGAVGIGTWAGQDHLVVWRDDGSVRQTLPVVGTARLTLGELDGDPGTELVLPDGRVFDLATLRMEGQLVPDLEALSLHDVDGDGIDEQLRKRAGTWELVDGSGVRTVGVGAGAVLGDFDADGTSEIVLSEPSASGGQWSVTHVLDARLLTPRSPPIPARVCDRFRAFDHDDDGASQLVCMAWGAATAVLDVATGARVPLDVTAAPDALRPTAADFDGDGVREVLWSSTRGHVWEDRVVLRDAAGEVLDTLHLPLVDRQRTDAFDVDGDGDAELVRGLRVWDWSPGTGFTRLPDLGPSVTAVGCVQALGDLDGDGALEMLFDDCRISNVPLQLLDLSNGAVSSVANAWADVRPIAPDLDGDGVHEVVFYDDDQVFVTDLSGTVLDAVPGKRFVQPAPGLLVVGLYETQTLYAWSGSALVVRDQLTAIDPPYELQTSWAAGRIWTWGSSSLEGWSPVAGTPSFPVPYAVDPVAVGGVLWAGSETGPRGYVLP